MRQRPRAPGDGAAPPDPGGQPRHERSHPKYRPDAGEPTLRRQDPCRRHVPRAGGARQEALPHAWRRTGIRRTQGKPERAQARPVHRECDRRATADSGAVGGSKEAAGGDEVMELSQTARQPGRGITNQYCAPPSRRPLRGLLRMRSSLLKHIDLMLRSERRERLEAWAASELPFAHSQSYAAVNFRAFFARTGNRLSIEKPTLSARMMVAIVSKRGLAPGASVL